MAPLRVEVAGETNVGRKRSLNEDNFCILSDFGLYLVADGMGGHASGEVASKLAIDTIREFYERTADDPERTWPYKMDKAKGYEENRLITAVKLANLRIFEQAQRDSKSRGMGTTIVSIFTVENGVYCAHVGDSRIYRVRDGKIEQMTEDHSLLNDYIKMKHLTPEEIANFPHKNVIVRALGMKETVKVDTRYETPMAGDTYLMCSDGLCGPVNDNDILNIIVTSSDLKTASRRLIDKANENGGPDNITAVLARWVALARSLSPQPPPHLRGRGGGERGGGLVRTQPFLLLLAPPTHEDGEGAGGRGALRSSSESSGMGHTETVQFPWASLMQRPVSRSRFFANRW